MIRSHVTSAVKAFALTLLGGVALSSCSDMTGPTTVETGSAAKSGGTLVTIGGCEFLKNDTDMTLTLTGNCSTSESIEIPDGYTLDGKNYTITAIDPSGGSFDGAVVTNESGASEVHVTRVTITADNLANTCDAGDDRLRGILFEGTSGSITHTTITGINQGPSGCQEGNAIEVRNAPFDGTHPGTVEVEVEIANNTVTDYQKTGIVANGDVEVDIHHNRVGASATQENLAANSVQIGFGAYGSVENNNIDGNQWKGTSNYAASAILVYANGGDLSVSKNNIGGNSDIGIYIYGDGGTYDNNRVFDEGSDHVNSSYDYGIGNWGSNHSVTNNKVSGFEDAYDGVSDGKNKTIPSPQS